MYVLKLQTSVSALQNHRTGRPFLREDLYGVSLVLSLVGKVFHHELKFNEEQETVVSGWAGAKAEVGLSRTPELRSSIARVFLLRIPSVRDRCKLYNHQMCASYRLGWSCPGSRSHKSVAMGVASHAAAMRTPPLALMALPLCAAFCT